MADPPMEPSEVDRIGQTVLPDTIFKSLTRLDIEEQHLRVKDSEFQHVTRADMVIEKPEGVDTTNTMFDFCAPVTVLEFKSQNDSFDLEEFVVNQVRTAILFLQDKTNEKKKDYRRFLNAYVLARYPREFLDTGPDNGVVFTVDPNRPWLRWATVGYQRIVLIICRDLPIEKRFYRWLLFAPSKGKKWPAFIRRLREEGNLELLAIAEQLRPKEYRKMKINAKEIWEEARRAGALTPEVEAYLAKERAEGIANMLDNLDNRDFLQMSMSVDYMTDEQISRMVNKLSLIRLIGLINYLKPYQIERLLPHLNEKDRQLIQNLMAKQ